MSILIIKRCEASSFCSHLRSNSWNQLLPHQPVSFFSLFFCSTVKCSSLVVRDHVIQVKKQNKTRPDDNLLLFIFSTVMLRDKNNVTARLIQVLCLLKISPKATFTLQTSDRIFHDSSDRILFVLTDQIRNY